MRKGTHHSDKSKRKMSKKLISDELKKKLSQIQKQIGQDPEERKRRSLRAKALGVGLWMKGRRPSPETSAKRSQHRRGKTYEQIYGDRAEEEKEKRRSGNRDRWKNIPRKTDQRPHQGDTFEYSEWRTQVFKRDNYTCIRCGKHREHLNAHHIKFWSSYPQERFNVQNGQTLCRTCHTEVHQLLKKKQNG